MLQKKYEIIWQQRALSDLNTFINYIAEDNPFRAESFLEQIRDRVTLLSYQPKMGRLSPIPGTRQLVVHQNYIVYYRFHQETVRITRIKHAAQQPLLQSRSMPFTL